MTLSFDSNVLIDLMRSDRAHIRSRMRAAQARGEDLIVSTIVAQKLAFGAHASARPAHQLELFGAILEPFRVESWSWEDALATGRLRADRERLGRRLPAYDLMIAGQALARGWTVITANVRDFWEVEGLKIQDWSDPGQVKAIAGGLQYRPPPR
ncbi:PIN domain-containing protein [Phenylobacterium sp.]|uniref:PIN domain-containing protein n=1 Tax=Phenylobacterium sp. TaxID=1871053 RepID=UPI0025F1D719|nr:PIN domain-containing protein [Phenylobacterium sp.]MBX3483915.1 PIN domain-containing protein [Phenylobacterium sp.]MCW5760695.1 PIN domain-containing protein [Phenylobacterium sp.]